MSWTHETPFVKEAKHNGKNGSIIRLVCDLVEDTMCCSQGPLATNLKKVFTQPVFKFRHWVSNLFWAKWSKRFYTDFKQNFLPKWRYTRWHTWGPRETSCPLQWAEQPMDIWRHCWPATKYTSSIQKLFCIVTMHVTICKTSKDLPTTVPPMILSRGGTPHWQTSVLHSTADCGRAVTARFEVDLDLRLLKCASHRPERKASKPLSVS